MEEREGERERGRERERERERVGSFDRQRKALGTLAVAETRKFPWYGVEGAILDVLCPMLRLAPDWFLGCAALAIDSKPQPKPPKPLISTLNPVCSSRRCRLWRPTA